MSITSLAFAVFVFALLLIYYGVPKKYQWMVLLGASLFFYLTVGGKAIIYILATSVTVYAATNAMQSVSDGQKAFFKQNKDSLTKEDKKAIKQKNKIRRRRIMLLTLIFNIGLLCVFKYLNFVSAQINALASLFGVTLLRDRYNLIVPLGISFYTFQSVGYLVDVYWENVRAEKNYAKVLLFVSFFPQITQGPISEFEQLSEQLFAEHTFSYHNYSYGLWRMVWGFMKKMILANMLAPYVADVFSNYAQYAGITVFIGAVMYSVQIYADFSGYMDIMCGLCQMLGITLTENFMRPYFSKSVAEYWRRWHISLGAWFKKYIYFPIAMSGGSRRLAGACRERFGKHFADTLPASLALIVTWLATGLWHGASWSYIVWGGVNGMFIILSLWMEPLYNKLKTSLRIDEDALWLRVFRVVRTFILVTFIKVLPEVGTLSQGLGLIGRIFTGISAPLTGGLLPFVTSRLNLLVVLAMTALLFAVSVIQRRRKIRDIVNKVPLVVRVAAISCAFLLLIMFGVPATGGNGGFMYAQF